jgi:sugar lactone lactonase YvrE
MTSQGNRAAVYSCATNRVDLGPEKVLNGPTWLPDGRRILFWDYVRSKAVLWNRETNTSRDIPGLPGPSEFQLDRDGRTLLMNHSINEGDIWMLTLK